MDFDNQLTNRIDLTGWPSGVYRIWESVVRCHRWFTGAFCSCNTGVSDGGELIGHWAGHVLPIFITQTKFTQQCHILGLCKHLSLGPLFYNIYYCYYYYYYCYCYCYWGWDNIIEILWLWFMPMIWPLIVFICAISFYSHLLTDHKNPCPSLHPGHTTRLHFPAASAAGIAMWLSSLPCNINGSNTQAWPIKTSTKSLSACWLGGCSNSQGDLESYIIKMTKTLGASIPKWLHDAQLPPTRNHCRLLCKQKAPFLSHDTLGSICYSS